MTHKKVYGWFKIYFPQFFDQVEEWWPCGKNCIRVRLENGRDYVFTYNGGKHWRLETVESFIKSMKGDPKMKC
jgi:hypothetical protein